MGDPSKVGGKLGPKVAGLMAKATILARTQSAPHTTKIAMKAVDDYINLIGHEIRTNAGDVLSRIADDPDAPAWARKLFGFVARGHGEATSMLSLAYYGSGLGNVIVQYLSNEMNPVLTKFIADNPNAYISPGDAATLAARRFVDYPTAAYEARRGGISDTRFGWLHNAAFTQPGLPTLYAMINRGLINPAQFGNSLRWQGYDDWAVPGLEALRHELLQPASLADMVVRGIIEEAPAAHEAEQQGVTGDRFAKLVLQSGMPPAIEQMLFLYRRGLIDKARLIHGIRQSRVRNEWIDAIIDLQFTPLSPGDSVQAHVQGHMDEATSKRKWAEGGMLPEDWQPAFETAGDPIAIGQALDLWDRGKMTEAEVTQAIRESRIKNKYIEHIKQLAVYLPPVRTVVAMLRSGSITEAYGRQLLKENGVRPLDIDGYVNEAKNNRSSTHREFTASQVQEFYRDGAIVKSDANGMLIALGFDQEDVDLILINAEFQQVKRARDQAINRVHASYVGHKIDRPTASADLSALHVPDSQSALLLDLWDDELNANVRVLTEAQVIKAIKKRSLSSADGLSYLQFLGYGERDARILLNNEGIEQP